ncbi:MAG: 50S ribosomal protein L18e [Candidatus Nanoarchaeia archaeon]|jgi:large subunit ribosomal protein L18e
MKKGTTSYHTQGLINDFEKLYRKTKKPLFKRIVDELKKSSRQKRDINLSKINRYSIEGSNIIVLGKVLSSGELEHKVNIVAFSYSKVALDKLNKKSCTASLIDELAKTGKIPSKVIILG